MITNTCLPLSNARYSAKVRAVFGVMVRSIDGSSASDRKSATLSSTPVSSNESMKKRATSYLTPIAAKTMQKSLALPRTFAWRAICAASWLWARPLPLKIGSFCPWIRVVIPSMTETPVWMKSRGYSRAVGLMAEPLTSRSSAAWGSAEPSLLCPRPFMTRPSICSLTPKVSGSPMKRMPVSGRSSPSVPSKAWTQTTSSLVSSTWPALLFPSEPWISTSSP